MNQSAEPARRSRGMAGMAVAGCTAAVSGVSVYVNSRGVHAVASPAVYTTAKNLVAAVALATAAALGLWIRRRRPASGLGRFVTVQGDAGPAGWRELGPAAWTGVAYVGIVGGGLAFVLFFDGLAKTTAAPAAFLHDTLVVWVGLLAMPLLHERVRWWNLGAVVALVAGEVAMNGGVGKLAADSGELLVLAATVLWAVEVVVARVLLRHLAPSALGLIRMTIGAGTLVVYLGATGEFSALVGLDLHQVAWALLTGLLLGAYVGTWMTALARARALDVTSVLVAGALVTWLLQSSTGSPTSASTVLGLLLVLAGSVTVLWAGLRGRDRGAGEVTQS